jgi:EamA domain-containing membrane protein RarD
VLVQIAALAWLFLGERLAPGDVVGLILATAGILISHLKPTRTPMRVLAGGRSFGRFLVQRTASTQRAGRLMRMSDLES